MKKIQELKRNHLNKSQVSKRLGIDYKTVLKYWDMPPDEFARARERSRVRAKKADAYKSYVVECLQKYPDMTAAQIDDWIRENYSISELPCKERAFRNYVRAVRKESETSHLTPASTRMSSFRPPCTSRRRR